MGRLITLPVIAIVLAIAHALPILAMLMFKEYGGLLILFSLCVLLLIGATLLSTYALKIQHRIRRRGPLGFEVLVSPTQDF